MRLLMGAAWTPAAFTQRSRPRGALPPSGQAGPPASGKRRAGRGESLRGLAGLGRGV